ncbi:MAG: hypothetical protein IJK08_11790 [Prevotella sp.]|nr:hypothetical protein [Prevotella sp.]
MFTIDLIIFVMRNKKYSKPYLWIELFHPQDYIAACTYEITGYDPVTGKAIPSSSKFWPDLNQTQVIDGEEFDWNAKSNTDGNHGPWTGTLLHAWWADSKHVADEIYQDHTKFTQYQQAEQQHAGWVDAVYVSKNDHYHVGKANIIVNGF